MENVKSEGWNWKQIKDSFWREPVEEMYYLLYRWNKAGMEKLLDLGCGVGRHSLFFAEKGFLVKAYDISESGIEELRSESQKRGLEVEIQLGDMLSLPYEDEVFDCLVAYHSIYHTDKIGIESTISEIQRILVTGGEALITFNSKNNQSFYDPTNIQIDENTIIKTQGIEAGVPHYYVDKDEVRRLLKDFEILKFIHKEEIHEDNQSSWHYLVLVKKR